MLLDLPSDHVYVYSIYEINPSIETVDDVLEPEVFARQQELYKSQRGYLSSGLAAVFGYLPAKAFASEEQLANWKQEALDNCEECAAWIRQPLSATSAAGLLVALPHDHDTPCMRSGRQRARSYGRLGSLALFLDFPCLHAVEKCTRGLCNISAFPAPSSGRNLPCLLLVISRSLYDLWVSCRHAWGKMWRRCGERRCIVPLMLLDWPPAKLKPARVHMLAADLASR
ncbi:hypothetical protein NUW54_g11278 [Trametes sanguinea]|uniref:Uncharacterized protein n=1 Tax=Trametes sanguinea TaxID=158606 RepID=A0ACC1NGR9_9APHY|nr:hypothetical protein NUW54_g11278 [Trametes sanguinea]